MAKPDTPHVDLKFTDLDAIEKPLPFVYATKSSKRVTFPDIYDMTSDDAEVFFDEISGNKKNSYVLAKWLSEEDYAALRADRLTLRQENTLIQRVQAHYEGTLGSQGEGDASES